MPTYQPGSEKKYFPTLIAALIAIAIMVASLIYSLILGTEGPALKKNLGIDPTASVGFPSGEPKVVQPANPP